jgi:hypothetical protein
MDSPIRPLFLLADSQLLFFRDARGLFLDRVREALGEREIQAAYLGASNGDEPAFYELFVAAVEGIGVRRTRLIPAVPSDADRAFLDHADLILLAGGDAERGLAAFAASGIGDRVVARYAEGAVLIGVSAGAVQLGLGGFRLAPVHVGAHEEPEWAALTAIVEGAEGTARGLGIPAGAGAVVHADLTVEPVRKALVEISAEGGVVRRALLAPC